MSRREIAILHREEGEGVKNNEKEEPPVNINLLKRLNEDNTVLMELKDYDKTPLKHVCYIKLISLLLGWVGDRKRIWEHYISP